MRLESHRELSEQGFMLGDLFDVPESVRTVAPLHRPTTSAHVDVRMAGRRQSGLLAAGVEGQR